MAVENYTLGRGELHLAKRDPITGVLGGYRFLGNAPNFALAVTTDKLEHFRSTRGIKEKDLTINIQTNRTGTMTLEDISTENLSLFFLGSTALVTQASATGQTEVFTNVQKGYSYQVGVTDQRPTGSRSLTGVTVTVSASAKVEHVDYEVDLDRGIVYILADGTIANGASVTVGFGLAAVTREQTISGSDSVSGAMKFIAYPAEGRPIDYFMPHVEVSPNGDFNLIADELTSLPLTVDIQAQSPREAIYMDGKPYVPA